MKITFVWAGMEFDSLEHCLVNTNDSGADIHSVITGQYRGAGFRVQYKIIANNYWETLFCEINSQFGEQREHIILERIGNLNWMWGGLPAEQFNRCIDVDISLTPFTNSLPINRLNLAQKEFRQIEVLYIDLLAHKIIPVQQKYTRLSSRIYHYENVPNDFEADIEVDEEGFVVDYPSLFVRKGRVDIANSQ